MTADEAKQALIVKDKTPCKINKPKCVPIAKPSKIIHFKTTLQPERDSYGRNIIFCGKSGWKRTSRWVDLWRLVTCKRCLKFKRVDV